MSQELDENVIRDFNDRGIIWLLESVVNFKDLMSLLSNEISDKLDFSRAVRGNRSFVPDNLYKQEADLIYRAPYLSGEGEVIVCLLAEHQSKPDRRMGLRYLSYEVRIWEEEKRHWDDLTPPRPPFLLSPILPILLYTGEAEWKSDISLCELMNIPSELEKFVPQYSVLVLKLYEIDEAYLRQTNTTLARILLAFKSVEEPLEKLLPLLTETVAWLETLPAEKSGEWRRAMHFLLLLIRHKRRIEEREPLFQQIVEAALTRQEEITEMVNTDAQVLMELGEKKGIEIGRKEGIKEGIKEGHYEGRKQMLLSYLQFKFQLSDDKVLDRINLLSDEQIDTVFDKAMKVATLDEAFK